MKRHEKQIYPLYSFVFYQRRIGEAARNEKANEIIKHLKGLSADSPFYIDKGAWRMSKVEPNLYDHEERIVNLEGDVREIQEDLRERYARIDESNKYLRELSQEQINQNGHILNSVLTGNQEAAKRQDEMKKAAAKTRADLWLKAIGSGGVFYLIVDMIIKLLK